jgi:hypothetical protein
VSFGGKVFNTGVLSRGGLVVSAGGLAVATVVNTDGGARLASANLRAYPRDDFPDGLLANGRNSLQQRRITS